MLHPSLGSHPQLSLTSPLSISSFHIHNSCHHLIAILLVAQLPPYHVAFADQTCPRTASHRILSIRRLTMASCVLEDCSRTYLLLLIKAKAASQGQERTGIHPAATSASLASPNLLPYLPLFPPLLPPFLHVLPTPPLDCRSISTCQSVTFFAYLRAMWSRLSRGHAGNAMWYMRIVS